MNLETVIENIALKVRYTITRISGGGLPKRYVLAFYGNHALTLAEDGRISFPNGVNYRVDSDAELTRIIEEVASYYK